MNSAQQEAIVAAVGTRVRSFEAAERARDPEQLLAHYASGPEFHFYHDGRRANYDVIAAGVRKALPGVRSLEVTATSKHHSAQTMLLSVPPFAIGHQHHEQPSIEGGVSDLAQHGRQVAHRPGHIFTRWSRRKAV
jgi:hypothetical protein